MTWQVFKQVLKKMFNVHAAEVMVTKLNVEGQTFSFGGNAKGTDCRYLASFEGMTQKRGLPFRCPRPLEVRNEQESAFVEEYQMGREPFSVFLYAATDIVSNARSAVRFSVMRGVLASDS